MGGVPNLVWRSSSGLRREGLVEAGRPAEEVVKEIAFGAEPHRSLELGEADGGAFVRRGYWGELNGVKQEKQSCSPAISRQFAAVYRVTR